MVGRKLFAVVFLLGLMLTPATGCIPGKKVAAVVNGEKIYLAEVDAEAKKALASQGNKQEISDALRRDLLQVRIERALIRQQAEKEGLKVEERELNQEMEKVKKHYRDEKQMEEAFAKMGMTLEDYRKWLEYQLLYQKLYNKVTGKVEVREDEIKKYYEENRESRYTEPEKARFRQIVIKFDTPRTVVGRSEAEAEKKAKGIIAQLRRGADFARLAKENSEDPNTASKGGLFTYGGDEYVPRGVLGKDVEDAIYSLRPGQFTLKPVKTMGAFMIFRLEERKPARVKSFDEVRNQVRIELLNQKRQEKWQQYMEKVRKQARVEIKI